MAGDISLNFFILPDPSRLRHFCDVVLPNTRNVCRDRGWQSAAASGFQPAWCPAGGLKTTCFSRKTRARGLSGRRGLCHISRSQLPGKHRVAPQHRWHGSCFRARDVQFFAGGVPPGVKADVAGSPAGGGFPLILAWLGSLDVFRHLNLRLQIAPVRDGRASGHGGIPL